MSKIELESIPTLRGRMSFKETKVGVWVLVRARVRVRVRVSVNPNPNSRLQLRPRVLLTPDRLPSLAKPAKSNCHEMI